MQLDRLHISLSRVPTLAWAMLVLGAVTLLAMPFHAAHAQVLRQVHIRQKLIALTFDDGPGPETLAIAEILKREHVPATFFEVGRSIAVRPTVTQELVRDGFEIEDHTWDHPFDLARMHPRAVYNEIVGTADLIRSVTGRYPSYFRPPHGEWNSDVVYEAQRAHLTTILWSVDPGDWKVDDPARLTSSVVDWVRPGAIVVLHDNLQDGPTTIKFRERKGTREALPQIIEALHHRGYRFVTLSELLHPSKVSPPSTVRIVHPILV